MVSGEILDFPAFGQGLSLRRRWTNAELERVRKFPRLRAGTFIEVPVRHILRYGPVPISQPSDDEAPVSIDIAWCTLWVRNPRESHATAVSDTP